MTYALELPPPQNVHSVFPPNVSVLSSAIVRLCGTCCVLQLPITIIIIKTLSNHVRTYALAENYGNLIALIYGALPRQSRIFQEVLHKTRTHFRYSKNAFWKKCLRCETKWHVKPRSLHESTELCENGSSYLIIRAVRRALLLCDVRISSLSGLFNSFIWASIFNANGSLHVTPSLWFFLIVSNCTCS